MLNVLERGGREILLSREILKKRSKQASVEMGQERVVTGHNGNVQKHLVHVGLNGEWLHGFQT